MSHSKVLGYQVMIDSEVQGVLTLDMQVVNNVNLENIIHFYNYPKSPCPSTANPSNSVHLTDQLNNSPIPSPTPNITPNNTLLQISQPNRRIEFSIKRLDLPLLITFTNACSIALCFSHFSNSDTLNI